MAKKIGSLYAVLGLNSAYFQKGFKNATRSMNKFGRDMKKIGLQMGKIFAVGAAATATALVAMTKNAMEQADEIGKLSDRLNIATEKLGGLQYAARITGASSESLNKALEKMSKNLGDAALGTGLAKKSLESMGLDVEKIIGMNANDQFLTIGDAIGKLDTQAEKAAASMAIFGRDGMSMINMFDEGKEGIERYQKAAEKLGFTFTRIEAKQIENANDALETLKTLMTVIGGRLAVEFSGIIKTIADRFVDAGNSGEGFKARVQRAIEVGIKGGAQIIKVWQFVVAAFETAKLGIAGLGWGVTAAVRGIVEMVYMMKNAFVKTYNVIDAAIEKSSGFMALKFTEAVKKVVDKLAWLVEKFNAMSGVLGMPEIKFADNWEKKLNTTLKGMELDLDYFTGKLTKAGEDFSKGFSDGFVEDNSEFLDMLRVLQDEFAKDMTRLAERTSDAWKAVASDSNVDEFLKKLKAIKLESETLAKAQVEAAKGVTKTLADTGKAAAEANSKTIKKAQSDTDRFTDGLSSKFSQLMQEGNFTFKSIGAAIRDMALQQVFARAGSAMANSVVDIGTSLVAGFSSRGQAESTATMTGGSGGVGSGGYGTPNIVQNLSFGTGVTEASRAAVVSMMPTIQGATAAGVRDAAARRGG